MNIVCGDCGDIGFKHLLICCSECGDSSLHQYCLKEVIYDGPVADWLCFECQERSGEVTCRGSIEKASGERPSHAQSDSRLQQPIDKRVDPIADAGPSNNGKIKSGMTKYASLNKISSSEINSWPKKHVGKKSNVKKMGDCNNRKGCDTIVTGLHSCEKTGTETTKKNNGENQQVDNANFDSTNSKQPTPLTVNCLGYNTPGDKAVEGSDRKSKRTPKSLLRAQLKRFSKMNYNKVLGSKSKTYSPTAVHENSVLENGGANLSSKHSDQDNQTNQTTSVGCKNIEVKSGKDTKEVVGALEDKYWTATSLSSHNDGHSNVMDYKATDALQQRSMAANVVQQSTLQDNAMNKVMPCSPDMYMLDKDNTENHNMPSEHVESQNRKENHSEPSNMSCQHIEDQSRKGNQSEPSNLFDQVCSTSSLETYPAKFLPECSTAEVEISVDFGKDNPRKRRHLILLDDDDDDDDDDKEEKAEDVHLENVNPPSGDSNASNGWTLKKRRRYIDASEDEDEEANDGANLGSLATVAEEQAVQSRIASDSNTEDQQYSICRHPIDEPVWSGAFKMNSEVFGKLDAHLSSKACDKVWHFSRMLQPVVEVTKIARRQVWPRRWTSTTPTNDCIGLFFFPRSSKPHEESNKLVNEIIGSDDALKVAVGVVELLIFPSTLLSEQNQLFQGKYYLWGVFKRRKDKSDGGALVGEQDGVACATEQTSLQEQHVLHQQDDILCESSASGQETSVVRHAENAIMVERNCVAQKVAMNVTKKEGIALPGSKSAYAKPNAPEDGSNFSVDPRIDGEFHAPEEMNQQEEHLSSPVLNASSVIKSTSKSGHGESHSDSGAPTTKLFGLVNARTPRAHQLIQEMISEGALVFRVPEQETTDSCTRSNVGVGSGLNPDTENLREHPQSFDFISTGHGVPDVASEACLELFPVQQENIGWAPWVESTKEVDLDLSLSAHSRASSVKL